MGHPSDLSLAKVSPTPLELDSLNGRSIALAKRTHSAIDREVVTVGPGLAIQVDERTLFEIGPSVLNGIVDHRDHRPVETPDLLGLSRQVIVLAYQYGAGLCDLVTPTNGALMAILASAGVRYEQWMKFTAPLYLGLVALGCLSIGIAITIGLQ